MCDRGMEFGIATLQKENADLKKFVRELKSENAKLHNKLVHIEVQY